jgi:hypothetical protein
MEGIMEILSRFGVLFPDLVRCSVSPMFRRAAGRPASLRRHADKWGRCRLAGISNSRSAWLLALDLLNQRHLAAARSSGRAPQAPAASEGSQFPTGGPQLVALMSRGCMHPDRVISTGVAFHSEADKVTIVRGHNLGLRVQ